MTTTNKQKKTISGMKVSCSGYLAMKYALKLPEKLTAAIMATKKEKKPIILSNKPVLNPR